MIVFALLLHICTTDVFGDSHGMRPSGTITTCAWSEEAGALYASKRSCDQAGHEAKAHSWADDIADRRHQPDDFRCDPITVHP